MKANHKRRTLRVAIILLTCFLSLIIIQRRYQKRAHQKELNWQLLHSLGDYGEVRRLLSEGADPDSCYMKPEWSPITYAARYHYLELMKILIENGADVNKTCESSNTALHYAVQSSSRYMIELLIENGADPHINNSDGKTPLDIAKEKGSRFIYIISTPKSHAE